MDLSTNNLWSSVAMSETGEDSCAEVVNLLPEHRYAFRVSAANRIGQSDPADMMCRDVTTKDPWGIKDKSIKKLL